MKPPLLSARCDASSWSIPPPTKLGWSAEVLETGIYSALEGEMELERRLFVLTGVILETWHDLHELDMFDMLARRIKVGRDRW
jgi:hypothetical protein